MNIAFVLGFLLAAYFDLKERVVPKPILFALGVLALIGRHWVWWVASLLAYFLPINYSIKTCSHCGEIGPPLPLSQRVFRCEACRLCAKIGKAIKMPKEHTCAITQKLRGSVIMFKVMA